MIDDRADTVVAPPSQTGAVAIRARRRRRPPRRGPRAAIRGLAIAGAIALAVTARVVVGSVVELGHGDEALAAGDEEGARMHFRLAGSWYAPGNPWSDRALGRLEAMAENARRRGAIQESVLAWRSVRSAILGTAGLYMPREDRLERANEAIATLMVQQDRAPLDAERTDPELRASYRALLDASPTPRPGWTLLVLVGFGLWVGAALSMSARAFDADDRFLRPQGLRHLAWVAVGLVLFAMGLAFA